MTNNSIVTGDVSIEYTPYTSKISLNNHGYVVKLFAKENK